MSLYESKLFSTSQTITLDYNLERIKLGMSNIRIRSMKVVFLICLCLTLIGCKPTPEKNAKPIVISTTTMLNDLVKQIGGTSIDATSIMSPGGDPHLYQPTPKDVRVIAKSDLVIVSGLNLEGWIDDLVRNASANKTVIVASKGIDPIKMENTYGTDPHFWFDLKLWRIAAKNVAEALTVLVPETEKANITANLERYLLEIEKVEKECMLLISTIPKDQRVLVTSHDAFAYFGRAFEMEVVAIQGVSTEQEASNRDMINVIETIKKRNLKAVFIETSVNPALVKQVARETGVILRGPLYSDSIGVPDSSANTFLNAVSTNVKIIVKGLRGDAP